MRKFGGLPLTAFLAALFFILHSLSFPTPARAQGCPSGGVWGGTCCDYKDSSHHIPDPHPDCNNTTCTKEYFDLNPGGLNYGGECKYCNPNVAKHGSACEDTCNWSCAAGATPSDGDGDEPPAGVCPVPDYDTDRCCPLEASWSHSLPGWLQAVISVIDYALNGVFNATVQFKDSALEHSHVQKLTERYLGNYSQNYNDGAAPKLMPPTEPFIQDEAERERVHDEWGKWKIDVEGEVGGSHEGTGTVEGADWYLPKLDYATNFLNDALTRIPGQEDSSTSLLEKSTACEPVTVQLADTSGLEESEGTVLAADDELCHEILPGSKHNACVGENSDSVKINITQAVSNLLGGKIKVYPRFSFLEDIAEQSVGPTGFTRIFEVPWEPPYKTSDGETKGDFGINLSVNVGGIPFIADILGWQPNWGFSLGTFNVKEDAQILHTGTEALADWDIKQKLSPPGVYIIPPGGEEEEFEGEGDFLVEKTANPTRIANEDLPKDINFHIKITAKYKSTNITITNNTTVTKEDGSTFTITTDKGGNDITRWPKEGEPQLDLEAGEVWETNYIITATSPEFENSKVTDTVTLGAEAIDRPGGCEVCGLIGEEPGWRSQELVRILNDAGNAYGVPASVLAGVLYYEGWHRGGHPRVHEFDDPTVLAASAAGGRDPYCETSFAGAKGPFQFMNHQWALYKNAAIDSGARPVGYTPEICNILDAAYAAAMKMRTDVEYQGSVGACNQYRGDPPAANACNWTSQQISLVSCRYYGACGNYICASDPGGSSFCYCNRTNTYFEKYACEK